MSGSPVCTQRAEKIGGGAAPPPEHPGISAGCFPASDSEKGGRGPQRIGPARGCVGGLHPHRCATAAPHSGHTWYPPGGPGHFFIVPPVGGSLDVIPGSWAARRELVQEAEEVAHIDRDIGVTVGVRVAG